MPVAFSMEEQSWLDEVRHLLAERFADTVERLRRITLDDLTKRLSVLAQWRLEGGKYVPVANGPNMSEYRGVRRSGNDLQMGLNKSEIRAVYRLLEDLLKRVDAGKITLVPVAGG